MDKLKEVPHKKLDIPKYDPKNINLDCLDSMWDKITEFTNDNQKAETMFLLGLFNKHGVPITLENAADYKGIIRIEQTDYQGEDYSVVLNTVYYNDNVLFKYEKKYDCTYEEFEMGCKWTCTIREV